MTLPLDDARVASARLWATTRLPYLASALFAAVVVAAPGSGTVAIDRRWRVHADPDVVAGLSVPGLGALLVHLVGHLVRDHAGRADALIVDDAGAPLWTTCADAEINDDLVASDCRPPVADVLPGELGLQDGGFLETYYAALRHAPPPEHGPDAWDCGSGADGRPRPWDGGGDGMTAGQVDLLRMGVAEQIVRAAAEQPGTVPGGWLRWATSVLPSKTDWRRVLGAEIRRACHAVSGNVDYTYRRPSRRQAASSGRVVLPSLHRPTPSVAVVCDTSGSMTDDLLDRALAEIERLLTRAGLRAGVPVLAVDTEVQAMRRVSRADQVRLAGGGGTDMGAGIEAASRLQPRPDVIVVLTDGMTPWPDDRPRDIRVVVGVLTSEYGGDGTTVPAWARAVVIDDL